MSAKRGRNRWSARYEIFSTKDEDETLLGENNDESGRAWTLTWMFDVTQAIRAAAELTQVTGDRAEGPSLTAHSVTAEVRYRF